MKKKYVIFYSWQSDTQGKSNRNFIHDSLEKVIKQLNQKNEAIEITLLMSDYDETGSYNIIEAIFNKINLCNIFIADVTIINKDSLTRKTPNPNVLVELGYASRAIGFNKIVCIMNEYYGKIEDAPFDIKVNNIIKYNLADGDDKPNIKKAFISRLDSEISNIIDKYEQLTEKHNKSQIDIYDKNMFQNINLICDEKKINELLDYLYSNLVIFETQLNCIDGIIEFSKQEIENSFINQKINDTFKTFIIYMTELQEYTLTLFPHESRDDLYIVPKQKQNETYEDGQIRCEKERRIIQNITEKIKNSYSLFRQEVKQTLFI